MSDILFPIFHYILETYAVLVFFSSFYKLGIKRFIVTNQFHEVFSASNCWGREGKKSLFDIVIYNEMYVFGLRSVPGTELLKSL